MNILVEQNNELENKEFESKKQKLKELIMSVKEEAIYLPFNKGEIEEYKNELNNTEISLVRLAIIPIENFSNVNIKGDFTNWENLKMIKDNTLFYIDVYLLKGYKYYYCFEAEGAIICDFNNEVVENTFRGNELNNFIIIKNNEDNNKNKNIDNQIDNFNNNLDYNLKYLNSIIDDFNNKKNTVKFNKDESLIIEEAVGFSELYYMKKLKLRNKCDDIIIDLKDTFESENNKILNYLKEMQNLIKEYFNKIIIKLENSELMLFHSFDIKRKCFLFLPLYDKNGIKLKIEDKNSVYKTVSIKDILEKCKFFDYEQSNDILSDYNKSTDILKIYYYSVLINNIDNYQEQLLNSNNLELSNDDLQLNNNNNINNNNNNLNNDSENLNNNKNTVPSNSILNEIYERNNIVSNDSNLFNQTNKEEEKEIIPYKIFPEGINLNEYNLLIEQGIIQDVKTKDVGSKVIFEAIYLKGCNLNTFSGLVSSSTMKLYTTMHSKDIINILHIHLNDTSKQIAVDSVFLKSNEIQENFTSILDGYRQFNRDFSGKKLDYRFIFKDFRLFKVFYNIADNYTDEPKFEEIRLNKGSYVKLKFHEKYQGYFGKIYSMPLGMLARKDKDQSEDYEHTNYSNNKKQGYCNERHLEELPGHIEVLILFDNNKCLFENNVISNNNIENNKSKEHPKLIKLSSSNINSRNNDYIIVNIPVCHIEILPSYQQLEFQKLLAQIQIENEKSIYLDLDIIYNKVKSLEPLLDKTILNEKLQTVDNVKNAIDILETNIEEFLKLEDDNVAKKVKFISSIKDSLLPQLYLKLRLIKFSI